MEGGGSAVECGAGTAWREGRARGCAAESNTTTRTKPSRVRIWARQRYPENKDSKPPAVAETLFHSQTHCVRPAGSVPREALGTGELGVVVVKIGP